MGKLEDLEGVKDDKGLTVVWDKGDAENGLGGGGLGELKLDFGVGEDLRQQLIDTISAMKLSSADTGLHGGPKCR